MDLFSKIFRSTLGLDRQPQSDLRKPHEESVIERPDEMEVLRPDEIFRHFDHLFANFDRMFANFGNVFENFQLPESDSGDDFNSQPGSLRDQMLKQPDSERRTWKDDHHNSDSEEGLYNPFGSWFSSQKPYWNKPIQEKFDTDLDETVKMNGLDRFLDRPQEFHHHQPHGGFRSGFSRVSVNVRHGADGKVEQKRTMVDSEGNETTVLTRSVDGKTFEKTTTKRRNGEVETKEDWSNVDPEDQKNFKERWNLRSTPQLEGPSPSNPIKDNLDNKTESIFEKLFGPRHV